MSPFPSFPWEFFPYLFGFDTSLVMDELVMVLAGFGTAETQQGTGAPWIQCHQLDPRFTCLGLRVMEGSNIEIFFCIQIQEKSKGPEAHIRHELCDSEFMF